MNESVSKPDQAVNDRGKRCTRCSDLKDLSEFHHKAGTPDGHRADCKDCHNAQNREYRLNNGPFCRARDRARKARNNERVNATARIWRAANRSRVNVYRRTFKRRWPRRHHAHCCVRAALNSGRLVKPDACEHCGALTGLAGHHSDYRYPLYVLWLCSICHAGWHRENGPGLNGDEEQAGYLLALACRGLACPPSFAILGSEE